LPRYRIGFGERLAVLTLSNADLMMEASVTDVSAKR